MNKASVLKAMIAQRIQECRTLALRFPSFLPIRFPIFPLKRPREAQNDPANNPPDRPQERHPSRPCLIRSLGPFWSLLRALFGGTFQFSERANRKMFDTNIHTPKFRATEMKHDKKKTKHIDTHTNTKPQQGKNKIQQRTHSHASKRTIACKS